MPASWGLVLASILGTSPDAAVQDTARLRAVLAAEDARPGDLAGLAPVLAALASDDTLLVRIAVRALGRQERADLIAHLRPALSSGHAAIRAEAVNALGQSALVDSTDSVRRVLEDRIALETNPLVLGTILRTLGRLPSGSAESRDRTELLLVRASRGAAGDAAPAVLEGAALGLGALWRRTAASAPPSADAVERLVELLDHRHGPGVRRRAMAALQASQRTDSGMLLEALRDPEREVRRAAVLATFTQAALPGRERVIRSAWRDADPGVRYEALRAFARHMAPRDGCTEIAARLDDRDMQVTLLAVDLLGQCGATAAPRLASLASGPPVPDAWHLPARALVALARVSPALADSLLPRLADSGEWWARMYAARAAQVTGNLAALTRLARDRHPNVREAAVAGLRARAGHAMDSLYIAALDGRDHQLLLTAAQALDSTPQGANAVPALLRALDRLTANRHETSRDTRAALLAAVGTLGGPAHVRAVRRYLTDYDPAIARQAAALLTRWTGTAIDPSPRPLARVAVPTWRELSRYDRMSVVFVMKGGGRVVLRLRPFEAPTNVARFVRMARGGWFTGLTFHRVAANFVVQGGSPGANEYVGDGPFTRDELGLGSHLRGTVGVSTRGRDTGDGQIFFNLIDNWRLDHNYTIIADVSEGMDVVDAMLEGAVIERVEVTER